MAWTEFYTEREKDNPERHKEDTSQGWACTCGCNKAVRHVSHKDGPPNGLCNGGYMVCSPPRDLYCKNYDLIKWE